MLAHAGRGGERTSRWGIQLRRLFIRVIGCGRQCSIAFHFVFSFCWWEVWWEVGGFQCVTQVSQILFHRLVSFFLPGHGDFSQSGAGRLARPDWLRHGRRVLGNALSHQASMWPCKSLLSASPQSYTMASSLSERLESRKRRTIQRSDVDRNSSVKNIHIICKLELIVRASKAHSQLFSCARC